MNEKQPVFERPLHAVLCALALNGWACEFTNHEQLGSISWMSNSPYEIQDLLDTEDAAEAAVDAGFTDPAELIGHFLVMQTGVQVEVLAFPNEDAVRAAYSRVESLYDAMEEL